MGYCRKGGFGEESDEFSLGHVEIKGPIGRVDIQNVYLPIEYRQG